MSVVVDQNIEKGLAGKPELQKYASRLKAMDKVGRRPLQKGPRDV
jgi:hypothetical protein